MPVLYIFYDLKAFMQWKVIDLDVINKSLVCVNLMHSSFYIGASMAERKKLLMPYQPSSSLPVSEKFSPEQLFKLRIIGFALLALSVAIIMFYTMQGKGLVYFIQSSYAAYHEDRLQNSVDLFYRLTFSMFVLWGLLLIMLGAKNLKQYRNYIIFFVLPFAAVIFLTGDRSSAFPMIMLLFSIFYIKFHTTVKIPWRKILIIGFVTVYLVPIIRVTRSIPIKNWSFGMFIDVVTFEENTFKTNDTEDLNFISSTLYTTSNSLQTLVGTMKIVPDKTSYRYGFDYFVRPVILATPFYDLFITFPNGVRSNELSSSPSNWFSYNFSPRGTGLGYLQISEAYLNFGPIGIIVFYCIMSFFLTRFWFNALSVNEYRNKLTLKGLAVWLLFFNSVINWIRNDATGELKFLSWAWFIIYVGFYIIDIFQTSKPGKLKKVISNN